MSASKISITVKKIHTRANLTRARMGDEEGAEGAEGEEFKDGGWGMGGESFNLLA